VLGGKRGRRGRTTADRFVNAVDGACFEIHAYLLPFSFAFALRRHPARSAARSEDLPAEIFSAQ
jgi:hypothetical protein